MVIEIVLNELQIKKKYKTDINMIKLLRKGQGLGL